MHRTQFSFGDNVRACDVVITRDLELSGLKGEMFGVTTPSVTGVEVIGTLTADVAITSASLRLTEHSGSPLTCLSSLITGPA